MIPDYLKNSELFVECVEALGPQAVVLNDGESNKILDMFEKVAPLYVGGSRIDWSKVEKNILVDSPKNIIKSLNQLLPSVSDYSVYLFWNSSLPVIKTDLNLIIKSYDDVVCNGFETWMYNPMQGYVVENYYLGEIHVGIL